MEDPGLDAEDEIVGPGLEHGSLPRIHGEEGHIDLFTGEWQDCLAEFRVRLLNLLHGGFFPPVPEVQVPGVEKAQAEEIHQETDARTAADP